MKTAPLKHAALGLLICTGVLFIGTGCTSPGTAAALPSFDLAVVKKVIEEKNARFTRAHVAGDQATIDAMFTEDAKCLPPNAEPVIGRAAIAKLTADYLAYGVSEFREETTDFYGNEDVLIDQGNYVMVYGPDKVREIGKYVNIWRKEAGVWKIYSNIWNTNAAAAAVK